MAGRRCFIHLHQYQPLKRGNKLPWGCGGIHLRDGWCKCRYLGTIGACSRRDQITAIAIDNAAADEVNNNRDNDGWRGSCGQRTCIADLKLVHYTIGFFDAPAQPKNSIYAGRAYVNRCSGQLLAAHDGCYLVRNQRTSIFSDGTNSMQHRHSRVKGSIRNMTHLRKLTVGKPRLAGEHPKKLSFNCRYSVQRPVDANISPSQSQNSTHAMTSKRQFLRIGSNGIHIFKYPSRNRNNLAVCKLRGLRSRIEGLKTIATKHRYQTVERCKRAGKQTSRDALIYER